MERSILVIVTMSCCVASIFATSITKFGRCPDIATLNPTATAIDWTKLDSAPTLAYYRQNKRQANTCHRMRFRQNSDGEIAVETRWRDPIIYVPGIPASLDYTLRSTSNTAVWEMYEKLTNMFLGALYFLSVENNIAVVFYCNNGLATYSYDAIVMSMDDTKKFTYTKTEKDAAIKVLKDRGLETTSLQKVNQNTDFCNRVMDP